MSMLMQYLVYTNYFATKGYMIHYIHIKFVYYCTLDAKFVQKDTKYFL